MRLEPYQRVDDTPFSARRADIEGVRGLPQRIESNAVGLTALDYGHVVFRFQDRTGRLEEVTRRAPVLYLVSDDGVADVPFTALADYLRTRDARAFARGGFLVSPRYGLAFVPAEPDWVTALAAHCVDTWRQLGQGAAG